MKKAAALSLAIAVGCSAGAASTRVHEITVGAAASLTKVFEQLAGPFERAHPGTHLRFSFGSSDGLAAQIRAGAPIDVFASASPRWIDAVGTEPGIALRSVFARNHLVLVVPKDNPGHIARFADLTRARIRLVLAAAGVPAGDYARQAITKAGLTRALSKVVSNEPNVEAVVQKVALGEADAGIVYATDVTSSLRAIAIPSDADIVATDEIAILRDGATARAFVDYLVGPGQALLLRAGFLPPR